jgi:hypothetical protein
MHRSKLSTFVIDCQTADLEAAVTFWSRALGRRAKPPEQGETRYRELESAPSEPLLMIQRVEHESRIHLDIESDDVESEVARLEALGAKRVEAVRTWVVMKAPTGQRFCVVRPQRGALVLGENTWPSSATISFDSSPQHEKLSNMVGTYVGRTKTWLEPSAPPDESISELRVQALFGGRWLRFEDHGSVAGKPRAGEMLLGFHHDEQRFEHCWVDSFHTGTAMMRSVGEPRGDGIIAVTGSYVAGSETWGWRTELDPKEPFVVRAYNVSPDGNETIAIETKWQSRAPHT